jgi:mannan endo-1,4-beta-mannosidase
VIDAAYTNFYNNYLVNNDFDGSKCPNHINAVPDNNNVSSGCEKYVHPVNPNASKEAVELLNYFYSIKGKVIVAGQHNVLGKMSEVDGKIYQLTGFYPAKWGSDFGFADSTHDIDNIAYRKFLVPEIIKQHERGAIITLTYHQANPLIGEPCQFKGGIISKLTDEQWKELTTIGTPLYEKWRKQMDKIAFYLKELNQLNIPILFRPYHEMNGSWFWWGGRPGEEGFIKLWKQLYNYYTNYHKLNNLLWVWSPDNPKLGLKEFYPGDKFVDMIGCDIYPKKDSIIYGRHIYDQIVEIAGEKPIGIGECSILPTPEILKQQPLWSWFLAWGELVFRNEKEDIKALYKYPKTKTCNPD